MLTGCERLKDAGRLSDFYGNLDFILKHFFRFFFFSFFFGTNEMMTTINVHKCGP